SDPAPAAAWSDAVGATGRRPRRRAAYSVPALPEWRGAKQPRRTGPASGAIVRFDWRPILLRRKPAPARLRFPARPARGGPRAFGGGPYVWCAARLVRAPDLESSADGQR